VIKTHSSKSSLSNKWQFLAKAPKPVSVNWDTAAHSNVVKLGQAFAIAKEKMKYLENIIPMLYFRKSIIPLTSNIDYFIYITYFYLVRMCRSNGYNWTRKGTVNLDMHLLIS
jgi:hypothetical protein